MKRFVSTLFALLLALAPVASDAQILSRFGPFNPTDPAGTTSTTGVVMGLGTTCQMVVQKSGIVSVTFMGEAANNTASDGWRFNIVYGTGTPPANGTAGAAGGTLANPSTQGSANMGTPNTPVTITTLISGLSVGTLYWFDLQLRAVTGGTATIVKTVCLGNEE